MSPAEKEAYVAEWIERHDAAAYLYPIDHHWLDKSDEEKRAEILRLIEN